MSKADRLDEVNRLEKYLDSYGHTAEPIRRYIARRREEIEIDAAAEAPAVMVMPPLPQSASAEGITPEQKEEAIQYVESRGYSRKAAEEIVAKEGVAGILVSKDFSEHETDSSVTGPEVVPTGQPQVAGAAEEKQEILPNLAGLDGIPFVDFAGEINTPRLSIERDGSILITGAADGKQDVPVTDAGGQQPAPAKS